MTKTDFAGLKEKLGKFDPKLIDDLCNDRWASYEMFEAYRIIAKESAKEQHTKSAAIISELIEIIQSQNEEIKKINNQAGIDIKMVEYETVWVDPNNVKQTLEITQKVREKHFTEICKSLSETTTRLQKLREGKNG